MKLRHRTRRDLAGQTIDIHSHAGVSLKAYAAQEYPYAESLEGIAYRQLRGGVDVNVVFPYTPDLFFDPAKVVRGLDRPARRPLSPHPYAVENELLLREVYEFCPELTRRFLPFVSVDPVRRVPDQVRGLTALATRFPIYGIKINPVLCQSKITGLLGPGRALLDLAREQGWPFLLHTTSAVRESYSNAAMTFQVVEKNPDIRFCLAHCIGFHRDYLRRADDLPHVWVDTAALKIQVQMAYEHSPVMASRRDRVEADYADHCDVMRALVERFPRTIIWGSDIPAYSYICRRQQAKGVFTVFRLKALYEDEVAALKSLPPALRRRAGTLNALDFLFGNPK